MTNMVSLQEVIDNLDMVEDQIEVYLNKINGEIIWVSSEDRSQIDEEDFQDLSDLEEEYHKKLRQIVSTDDWIQFPTRYEIFEYNIVRNFCYSIEDEEISGELQRIIHGSGVFRRFKNTIYHYGIEKEWFAYRRKEFRAIAVHWLEKK